MRACPNCGERVMNDVTECPNCGFTIPSLRVAPPQQTAQATTVPIAKSAEPQKINPSISSETLKNIAEKIPQFQQSALAIKNYSSIEAGSTLSERKSIVSILKTAALSKKILNESKDIPATEDEYVNKKLIPIPKEPNVGDISAQAEKKAISQKWVLTALGIVCTAFLAVCFFGAFSSDEIGGAFLFLLSIPLGVYCIYHANDKYSVLLNNRKIWENYQSNLKNAQTKNPIIETTARNEYVQKKEYCTKLLPYARKHLSMLKENCILTETYFGDANRLANYIENGRAYTIREAITLLENDKAQEENRRIMQEHYEEMEAEARRQTAAAEEQARAAQEQARAQQEQARAAQEQACEPRAQASSSVDRTVCIGCRWQGQCSRTPSNGFCGAFSRG